MTQPDLSGRPSSPSDAVESYRNVAAIVIALMIMQAAIGGLSVVGPLTLLSEGASAVKIGVIVAGYAFGFMLGAYFAPRELMRIGHIRAISAFAATASVCAALLYANDATLWWITLEFLIGVCVAGLLAAGESWIADAAPQERRGAILSFYLVTSKIGFMIGPFIVAAVPPGDAAGFLIVTVLFSACLVPVCATRREQPTPPTTVPFTPLQVWHIAPSAIIAAFAAGLVSGSVLQLYALYVEGFSSGPIAGTAALFNAALIGGSVLAQWPAGLLSDRMDRRVVIAGLALFAAACAIALSLLAGRVPPLALFGLAALWGAGALSYYGVAVAHAADRAGEGEVTSMMSAILMMWALGSMVGPIMASFIMGLTGPSGLFLFAAAVLVTLAGAMLFRRADKAPVPNADKSDFEPTSSTSLSVIELTDLADEVETNAEPIGDAERF
ncbi:MFS transporter [Maricaulis sp. CAU 1757]